MPLVIASMKTHASIQEAICKQSSLKVNSGQAEGELLFEVVRVV
jgi:hypothetical protein